MQNRYTFWYMRRQQGTKTDYEKALKKVGTFSNVDDFWALYGWLVRPSDQQNLTDYMLFKDGIRPLWEEEGNKLGGKWMVRVKKGLASYFWEALVLAIIGEQFDVGNEICGAVVSIRHSEDIIAVWNRNADNEGALHRIRETIQRVLRLPGFIRMEYKRHDASLRDNSSFRNPGHGRGNMRPRGGSRDGSFDSYPRRSPQQSPQRSPQASPKTAGSGPPAPPGGTKGFLDRARAAKS